MPAIGGGRPRWQLPAVSSQVRSIGATVLSPEFRLPDPALSETSCGWQFPPVSSHWLPIAADVLMVGFQLLPPPVHGKVFRSARQEQEADTPPPDAPAQSGGRPLPGGTKPRGTPYLTSDLYALLFPPVADLIEVSFEWPSPLYPFQVKGIDWLARRRHALLADDMGLGKTIQAIAALRFLVRSGQVHRVLVVCPTSLKTNWMAEFRRWAPELHCLVVDGQRWHRSLRWRQFAHVFIASYESVAKDYDRGACGDPPFDLVVLDEAQKIKNPGTKNAQMMKALPRGSSWCLTGTPLENRYEDLLSIFQFVHPGLELQDLRLPEDRRQAIAPYMLRRRKEEVLAELPAKRTSNRWLTLVPEQRRSYDRALDEGLTSLRELGAEITIQHVFQVITRLKQICNFDPRTLRSCKLDYLREALEEVDGTGAKAVVFSQFVETLRFLRQALTAYDPPMYHGRLTTKERDRVVHEFRMRDDLPLLLVSLRAGGLGLNLQAASWVFHYDRWWNPAVERQAEDRAHRIGQARELTVERLICEDTIEERIHGIQERKRQLFQDVVDADFIEGQESITHEEAFEVLDLEPELARLARMRGTRPPGGPSVG